MCPALRPRLCTTFHLRGAGLAPRKAQAFGGALFAPSLVEDGTPKRPGPCGGRAGLVLRLRLPATLQPPVTASCPPRVAPPPFLRGGIWEGLPWPCLRVAWECLGIWIQPALDLDVR